MSRAIIQASPGALWVADRIPNAHFPQFQEELEQAMLKIFENMGMIPKLGLPLQRNHACRRSQIIDTKSSSSTFTLNTFAYIAEVFSYGHSKTWQPRF